MLPDAELGRDMDILMKSHIAPELGHLLNVIRKHMETVSSVNTPDLFFQTQELLLAVMIHSNQLSAINVFANPDITAIKQLKTLLSQYQTLTQDERVPPKVQDAMLGMLYAVNHQILENQARDNQPSWSKAALDLDKWQPGVEGQARAQTQMQLDIEEDRHMKEEVRQKEQAKEQLLEELNSKLDLLNKDTYKSKFLNQWDKGAKVDKLNTLRDDVICTLKPIANLRKEAKEILSTKRFNPFSSFEKLKAKLAQTTTLKQDAQRLQGSGSATEPSLSQEHGEKFK
jgi:hypothetical protein